MPRAVVASAYGRSDVIEVIDVPSRPPAADEIVVSVTATALNPWDARIVQGALGTDPAQLPLRLGMEATGRIVAVGRDAVGADALPMSLGEVVVGAGLTAALAAEITAPARHFLRCPPSLSAAQAAGLLTAGGTAVHALRAVSISRGDVLLVHGVAGSVGSMIAQLALAEGATVIGTAAQERHAALAATGVHPVRYGPGLSERLDLVVGSGVDAAIDTVGTAEALASSIALIHDPSRYASIVDFAGAIGAGGKALGHAPGADPGDEVRFGAMFRLVRLASDGALRVSIAKTFLLEEARDAFALLERGHAGGKIVLTP